MVKKHRKKLKEDEISRFRMKKKDNYLSNYSSSELSNRDSIKK